MAREVTFIEGEPTDEEIESLLDVILGPEDKESAPEEPATEEED